MSKQIDLEAIKRKILNLSNVTIDNGATEAEAMNAAKLAAKLLNEYNLNLNEVQITSEDCIKVDYETPGKSRTPVYSCIVAVANLTNTVIYISGKSYISYTKRGRPQIRRNKCITVFGTETDVAVATYMLALIENVVEVETNKYKKTVDYINAANEYGGRRRASKSFEFGMTDRINVRLYEMCEEQNNELLEHKGSQELMIIKDDYVKSEFKKVGIKLKNTTRTLRYNPDHHTAGENAGNNVPLNKGVSSGGQDGPLRLK